MIIVMPDETWTSDRSPAVTWPAHWIANFAPGAGEDYLSDLEEALGLFDHSRASEFPFEEFEASCLASFTNRCRHPPIFDIESAPAPLVVLGRIALELRWFLLRQLVLVC